MTAFTSRFDAMPSQEDWRRGKHVLTEGVDRFRPVQGDRRNASLRSRPEPGSQGFRCLRPWSGVLLPYLDLVIIVVVICDLSFFDNPCATEKLVVRRDAACTDHLRRSRRVRTCRRVELVARESGAFSPGKYSPNHRMTFSGGLAATMTSAPDYRRRSTFCEP